VLKVVPRGGRVPDGRVLAARERSGEQRPLLLSGGRGRGRAPPGLLLLLLLLLLGLLLLLVLAASVELLLQVLEGLRLVGVPAALLFDRRVGRRVARLVPPLPENVPSGERGLGVRVLVEVPLLQPVGLEELLFAGVEERLGLVFLGVGRDVEEVPGLASFLRLPVRGALLFVAAVLLLGGLLFVFVLGQEPETESQTELQRHHCDNTEPDGEQRRGRENKRSRCARPQWNSLVRLLNHTFKEEHRNFESARRASPNSL